MMRIQKKYVPLLALLLAAIFDVACEAEKPSAPLYVPAFDKANAFQHLTRQVAFGPRVPGTEAHENCLAYLDSVLSRYAKRVVRQAFEAQIERTGRRVTLTNLIASFDLEKEQRVLLAAHWDSRPWADADGNPDNVEQAVPGANDGASGVAVLLEIARILKEEPPPVGVDIILFDGEDFGINGRDETWAIGSRHFAAKRDQRYLPRLGILLDMIGDRDLKIKKEGYSINFAPGIVEMVWDYAARLGSHAFVDETMGPITDDHLPLLNAGIPCINLIDLEYPYHHTISDTPDKCSAESLEQVGRVVLAVLYNPQ